MTRTKQIIGGIVVIGVLAIIGFVVWFLVRDVPDEVDIDTAVAGVTTEAPSVTTEGSAPPSTAPTTGVQSTPPTTPPDTAPTADIDGDWTITNDIGNFSYEQATGTFVGFRIDEELQGIGSNEAVGRTPEVSGSMTVEGTSVDAAEFTVDMTSITTDDSRRDNNALEAMKVDGFPTASFTLTSPIDFGTTPAPGENVSATARGDLTIAGMTNPIAMPLETQITSDGLIVVGSTEITMADFGVEVPQAPITLSASETATIEIQLWFTPAEDQTTG